MKKKLLLILFLMMSVLLIPTHQFKAKEQENILLGKEVERRTVFEPSVFLNGGEFSGEIAEDTLLHKGNYTIRQDLIIKEGVIVEVEAGSSFTVENRARIVINGTLKLLGEEEHQITFDYVNIGGTNNRFIVVNQTGELEINYTKIYNKAHTGMAISGSVDAIYNEGILKANYITIDSFLKESYLGNITNAGYIQLTNSTLLSNVILKEGSINNEILNNTFKADNNYGQGRITIPLSLCDLTNCTQIKNNRTPIRISGNVERPAKLSKNVYELSSDLNILENASLEVEAGSSFTIENSARIVVNGTLKLLGEEEHQITFDYVNIGGTNNRFIVVNQTGELEINYTKIYNKAHTGMTISGSVDAIYNEGILKANYITIDSFLKESYLGNITNAGYIQLTNSTLLSNIILKEGSSNYEIYDNKFTNDNNYKKGSITVPLEICSLITFQNIKNNGVVIELTGNVIGTVRLYKQSYHFKNNLEITENGILVVEEGTTLELKETVVMGILKLLGTEENMININYSNSGNSQNNNRFIINTSSGRIESNYTIFRNHITQGPVGLLDTIYNEGVLIADHIKMTSFLNSSVLGSIRNKGDIELTNSEIPYTVNLEVGGNNLKIENNKFMKGFVLSYKPQGLVSIKNNKITGERDYIATISLDIIDESLLNQITGNVNTYSNNYNEIVLTGKVSQNIKISAGNYYLLDSITIPENILFEVGPGATIKVAAAQKLTVNGILNFAGTIDSGVKWTSKSTSTGASHAEGIIINKTGKMIAVNTSIGGIINSSSKYVICNHGQLIMWNSQVSGAYAIQYDTTNLEQILVNNFINGSIISNIPLKASYNYWGTTTGPKRTNPDTGTSVGNSSYTVSDNVQFYPYYTSFVKNDIESVEYIKTVAYDMSHFGKIGVNSFNGNYSNNFTDFEVSNGLNMTRIYNSKNNKSDILGLGWSFSYSSYVEKHPYGNDSYIVHLPDSSVNIFTKNENNYTGINTRNKFQIINEKYTVTTKDQTIYTYSKSGKLESITDKYGNVTKLIYTNNLLTSIQESNRTYILEYSDNLLSKITDPIGRTTTYSYTNQLLTKVVKPNGIETVYTYNDKKQLVGIRENNVIQETLEYIKDGIYKDYIYKITNETGLSTTYVYDNISNFTTETDSNGRVTTKYYDRDGYVYKIVNPEGKTTTSTYHLEDNVNKYGELASFTEINSAKTIYTRGTNGNITKITNPDASTKQYVYNSKNQIIKETDEVGSITEYIYDTDFVTLLKQVKPLDGKTVYSEEADQNLFTIISYTYYEPSEVNNIKGLIKTKTDENGTITYTYNSNGEVITITDGNNHKTVYNKNALGWILSEQIDNGYITEYEYDNNGNQTSIKKDSKLISKIEYNYQNKPVKVIDGNCNPTVIVTPEIEYQYLHHKFQVQAEMIQYHAPQQRFLQEQSETGNESTEHCVGILYEYDYSGNKTKETDREGNRILYTYDQYGNVTSKTNPNGSSYHYEYDKLNRLIKTSFKDTNDSDSILLEEKSYVVSSTSTVTTKTYINDTEFKTSVESYNNRGWKIIDKQETVSTTTNYLKNGQVLSTINKLGGYTYYYYDKVNRLTKKCVQVDGSYTCTLYEYDNFGRLIREKQGKQWLSSDGTPSSNITTNYEYDNIGQMIKKTTSSGLEELYTYDIYGNVIKEQKKISDNKYSIKTKEYNYLHKVTKESIEGITSIYEYDNVGNLTKSITGENVVTIYNYNQNYQLVKKTLDGVIFEQNTYDNMGNVITKIDANGNETTYTYDKRNNVIKEINPKNYEINYRYDYDNRLIEMKDSKTTSYGYDKYDNIILKTINDTITYQYAYDNNHNLIKETDPLGYVTTYTYNKLSKLSKVTDKLGNYKSYTYDALLNMVAERNEKGINTYYVYDDLGNITKKTVSSIVVEQNEYDFSGNLIKSTDGNSNVTTYEYNTLNQLIQKTNPLGYIEEYEYDKNGNVTKIKDSFGKVILYSYDNRGNVIKTVEQKEDGTEKIETSKEYDNNNNVLKEVDGNGSITTYTYDAFNNVIKVVNPLNQETLYEYDRNNNLIKETNYLNDSKVYIYDSFGRLIEKKNELNETIEKLEYDLNGRQIKSIDGLNHETTYVYDKLDRVIEKINPLNVSEKTTYDALGNILTKTDSNGNITRYVYNGFNKVTKVTNAFNQLTFYTYDNNGNLLSVTDPNNKKTYYTYNALNLELTEKDSLGNIETKEYDVNGLLKKKTTKNGSVISYTYDIHGRKLMENATTYEYDNVGNLLKISENGNIIIREYDKLNRVVKKTENGMITTFTYSDYTEKSVDPKGNEVVKHYDKTGRLSSIEGEVTYTYNLDGTVKKLVYQNGAMEEYFYNEDKTLKKLLNTYNDHKDEFIYEYDNNKNIVFKNEKGKESIYTYDALNRLKTIGEVTYEEVGNEELERVETLLTTYLYDKNGNRIKEISLDKTKEYIYDSNNRLIKVVEKENNITKKTTFYTYDKNGNELTETENGVLKVTNTYNGKNELVKTVVDSKETNYVYNAEGKRIEKRGEKTIKYIYEGLDVILELDEDNNEIGHNVYGLALVSRSNSSKGYYLYNGHRDTVTIVDLEENALNNYTYDEWGVIIESDGEFENPYRYAGYYYDTETDNYYLLSRYYNPEIGRFISEDSYRGEYNDPLSLNRYVYVTNNPLIYVDPEGYFGKTFQKFFGDLWDETKNFGITLGAAIHGGAETLGEMAVNALMNPIEVAKLGYYESAYITNEVGYKIGFREEDIYKEKADKYGKEITDITSRKNVLTIVDSVITNFAITFNVDNIEMFMDKETPYKDKVGYAKEATKTALTIYGTYKTGQGIYNRVTNVNTAGTIQTYGDNSNILNTSLSRVNPYNGQQTYLIDYGKIINQYNWGNPETLYKHFEEHGPDFNAKNPTDYASQARDFYQNKASYQFQTGNDGIIRVYDKNTNTFGAYNIDTTTKTFFKPKRPNYWMNQSKK